MELICLQVSRWLLKGCLDCLIQIASTFWHIYCPRETGNFRLKIITVHFCHLYAG